MLLWISLALSFLTSLSLSTHAEPLEITRQKAIQELATQPSDLSRPLPTPATVSPITSSVSSPVRQSAFHIGFSVERYQPRGRGQIVGQDRANWDQVNATFLPSLELRWLPFSFNKNSTHFLFGGFASVGYNEQGVVLRAVTGRELPKTRLHTLQWHLGPAAEWISHWSERFSVGVHLGLGEWRVVQSSSSAFASSTETEMFFEFGVWPKYRVLPWLSGFIGYEYRRPVNNDNPHLRLMDHHALLGLLGSFR